MTDDVMIRISDVDHEEPPSWAAALYGLWRTGVGHDHPRSRPRAVVVDMLSTIG